MPTKPTKKEPECLCGRDKLGEEGGTVIDIVCHKHTPSPSPVAEEWEKQFDEYYPELLTEAGEVRENVKLFIRTLLAEKEKEAYERGRADELNTFLKKGGK